MRIRTIKPEFHTNEKLSALSIEVHYFAVSLTNYADDEGFFNRNPGLIKAALFPLRELSLSIPEMLSQLADIGFVRLGEAPDGRRYGHIVNFLEHQVINRPTRSKIKDLPIVWDISRAAPAELTEPSVQEGNREQGTGNREVEAARHGEEQVLWEEVWNAFGTWPVLPPAASEDRARSEFQKLGALAPLPPYLVQAILAHGRALKRSGGDRPPYSEAPHNWLQKKAWEGYRDEVQRADQAEKDRKAALSRVLAVLPDHVITILRSNIRMTDLELARMDGVSFEPGPPACFTIPNGVAASRLRDQGFRLDKELPDFKVVCPAERRSA